MTGRRRLVFTALTTLVLLGLVEGTAAVLERTVYVRVQPLPVPGAKRLPIVDGHAAIPLTEDPDQGWGLTPGTTMPSAIETLRVNELGLRGPAIEQREDDEVRILTLGDSSIFGDGVPESSVLGQVAAQELAERWGRPVTTVNGGIPGYDCTQSRGVLTRVGETVGPDFVVVANLWSDVFPADAHGRVERPRMVEARSTLRSFATYRVARMMLDPWLASRQVGFASDPSRIGSLGPDNPTRTLLESYAENLHEMVDDIESLNAQPVFLVLPAPIDFDIGGVPTTVVTFRAAMAAVAHARGAPLLDAPEQFVEGGGSPADFRDQVHPSTSGHARLGRLLADLLEPLQPPVDTSDTAIARVLASSGPPEAELPLGTRVLELDVDLDRDKLMAQIAALSPTPRHRVRLARPGEVALGPTVHTRPTPIEVLTVAMRSASVLDAWIAVDEAGNGARLGPALACIARHKRMALLEGLAGIAPWRDFREVDQARILLTPDQGSSTVEVLLPLLPGARGGYSLVPVDELPPADCITPHIDVVRR